MLFAILRYVSKRRGAVGVPPPCDLGLGRPWGRWGLWAAAVARATSQCQITEMLYECIGVDRLGTFCVNALVI